METKHDLAEGSTSPRVISTTSTTLSRFTFLSIFTHTVEPVEPRSASAKPARPPSVVGDLPSISRILSFNLMPASHAGPCCFAYPAPNASTTFTDPAGSTNTSRPTPEYVSSARAGRGDDVKAAVPAMSTARLVAADCFDETTELPSLPSAPSATEHRVARVAECRDRRRAETNVTGTSRACDTTNIGAKHNGKMGWYGEDDYFYFCFFNNEISTLFVPPAKSPGSPCPSPPLDSARSRPPRLLRAWAWVVGPAPPRQRTQA